MALIDELSFKAAADLAAAQLTIMWSDTVKTEMAVALKNPHSPLRQSDQLFLVNLATGVVTTNADYITAAYAGKYPPQNEPLGGVAEEAITLVSAAVADADPSDIVLTFSTAIHAAEALAIAGTVTTEKTISSVSISGAVVTIVVSSPYISTDTITVSGVFTGNNFDGITLAAEAVTNNVA